MPTRLSNMAQRLKEIIHDTRSLRRYVRDIALDWQDHHHNDSRYLLTVRPKEEFLNRIIPEEIFDELKGIISNLQHDYFPHPSTPRIQIQLRERISHGRRGPGPRNPGTSVEEEFWSRK